MVNTIESSVARQGHSETSSECDTTCDCVHCHEAGLDVSGLCPPQKSMPTLGAPYAELLRNLTVRFGPMVLNKSMVFACESSGELPQVCPWVEQAIQQVLERLLSNAVKFTEQGRIAIALSGDADGLLRVAVSDTGTGISARRLAALLETARAAELSPMDRAETTHGLDDCRKLLANLGTTLTLRSTPNIGTLAYFQVDTNAKVCDVELGVTKARS
ncbi:MAG: hypothetical protein CFE43_21290 [Burkholderiales bacterium PBB3]|nr:MAG: hypothetical protein CFE43_21290 [Burkholderiales bacterium PBB3]